MSCNVPAPQESEQSDGAPVENRFPTVGIGASAGGVQDLQELFETLPDPVPAAFVVVHLDPGHQSELPAILAAHTKTSVDQVTDRVRLEAGHVYVIPPNRLTKRCKPM
jgi:two-component system CheB/CheR fusion protein